MSREMKYSGIPWIGDIPKGWKVSRLKHLATDKDSLIIDGDWIESNVIEASGIRYLTTGNVGDGVFKEQGQGYISQETFNALNCTMVYAGDLVFSRLNYPMGRSCIIPEKYERCVVAVDNVIFRPNKDVSRRYLMYVSMCTGFQNENALIARGATMQRMSRSQLVRVFVPIPDRDTQQRIAEFLDRKCAEVDEMIALQEQIIEELKAYKQSVITEAVTKGLNPAAPMRDSGIEWIGQIPEHWEVARLKFYASIDSGDAISNEQIDRDGEYPVFGGGEIMGYYSQYNTDEDKLIIGRVGARCGCVTMPKQKCWASDNALVLKSCLPLKYTYHLLQAINLNRLNTSNAQPLITATKVKNVFIPLTPPTEQQAIADYLDEKCADIDSLIQTKQSKIDILKEYKKSIIYEYVTGKREVE